MLRYNLVPRRLLLRDESTHPLGDELVLRREVPVERHLVRPGFRRDGLDADAANSVATEEVVGRGENPLAGSYLSRSCHVGNSPSDPLIHCLFRTLPIGNTTLLRYSVSI